MIIELKQLLDEDFVNYKEGAMFLAFPSCDWKCGKELCQNSPLALAPSFKIRAEDLIGRYMDNPLTTSFVFGGLEPLDSFDDVADLICLIRNQSSDTIVIYTGYTEEEKAEEVQYLAERYNNIIVKFGRFIPNQEPHYDELLGVELASSNQYAKKIS